MVEIVVVYISGHKLMVKEGMIVMNMIWGNKKLENAEMEKLDDGKGRVVCLVIEVAMEFIFTSKDVHLVCKVIWEVGLHFI